MDDINLNDCSKETLISMIENQDKLIEEMEAKERQGFVGGWTLGDIMQMAIDGFDLDLSEDDARVIADGIEERHDCEIGITWETIDYAIQNYMGDK